MKKYFVLIVLSVLVASCSRDTKEYNIRVKQAVTESEGIVNIYDQYVKNAMDRDDFLQINTFSQRATSATDRILTQLKESDEPAKAKELKQSAISYIEAMQKLIKAQEIYSAYNDSITSEEADKMDQKVANVYNEVKHKQGVYIENEEKAAFY
ncbi:MAG: hypothetical protein ACK5MK_08710 [Dysgonomonas sp.]